MSSRYQDVYPSPPLVDSARVMRPAAADLLTLEYFEAAPGTMPTRRFDQHHILLNLRSRPQRVENRRAGVLRSFTFQPNEVVVTPAGLASGWRWYGRSRVIVVTLTPDSLARFARIELGIALTSRQLADVPQTVDEDLCHAGRMLRDALHAPSPGNAVMFEGLARAFLVKLVQRYGLADQPVAPAQAGLSARQHERVMAYLAANLAQRITVADLAATVRLHPSHFARLFKRSLGDSPMRFVAAYRLDQARRQLSRPEARLKDVAHDCGFADQAHLSRAFRQHFGESPSTYRQAPR